MSSGSLTELHTDFPDVGMQACGLGRGRKRAMRQAGFTLVEAVVAAGLTALGLAGVFLLGAQVTKVLRGTRESAAATQVVQERMEQFKSAGFKKLTYDYSDPTVPEDSYPPAGLIALLQVTPASMADPLKSAVETVTVSAYPAISGSQDLVVRRAGTSSPVVISDNYDLVDAPGIRVTARLAWTVRAGSGTATRAIESTTLFGQDGAPPDSADIVLIPELPANPDEEPPPPPPATPAPTPTPPPSTPGPTPQFCRHGKPFAHCGR